MPILQVQAARPVMGHMPVGLFGADEAVLLFRVGEVIGAAIHPQQPEGVRLLGDGTGHRFLVEEADASDVMGMSCRGQRRPGRQDSQSKQRVLFHPHRLRRGSLRLWLVCCLQCQGLARACDRDHRQR